MKRSLSLALVCAAACASPPWGATTVLSYVQLGWTGDFDDPWFVQPPCRPHDADPSVLAATSDGRWTAIALGETRVPCGGSDAVAVHVRETNHLVITAPAQVHRGEVFSVHVAAYDRDGQLLHRNAEASVWELDGLEPGDREGCMDIRNNDGDSRLVHASSVGDGRIHIALAGVDAYHDVRIEPAPP